MGQGSGIVVFVLAGGWAVAVGFAVGIGAGMLIDAGATWLKNSKGQTLVKVLEKECGIKRDHYCDLQ